MSRNKLFTLSYFRKRLRDAELQSKILVESFPLTDRRYWMIAISKDRNIVCTCFKSEDDFEFHFTDGKQLLGQDMIIKTASMNVVLDFLEKLLVPMVPVVEEIKPEKIQESLPGNIKWVDLG